MLKMGLYTKIQAYNSEIRVIKSRNNHTVPRLEEN